MAWAWQLIGAVFAAIVAIVGLVSGIVGLTDAGADWLLIAGCVAAVVFGFACYLLLRAVMRFPFVITDWSLEATIASGESGLIRTERDRVVMRALSAGQEHRVWERAAVGETPIVTATLEDQEVDVQGPVRKDGSEEWTLKFRTALRPLRRTLLDVRFSGISGADRRLRAKVMRPVGRLTLVATFTKGHAPESIHTEIRDGEHAIAGPPPTVQRPVNGNLIATWSIRKPRRGTQYALTW